MKYLELINLEAIDEKGYKNEYRGDVKVTIYKKKVLKKIVLKQINFK